MASKLYDSQRNRTPDFMLTTCVNVDRYMVLFKNRSFLLYNHLSADDMVFQHNKLSTCKILLIKRSLGLEEGLVYSLTTSAYNLQNPVFVLSLPSCFYSMIVLCSGLAGSCSFALGRLSSTLVTSMFTIPAPALLPITTRTAAK